MANWWATSRGNSVHSPMISVATGDLIHGSIYRTNDVPCGTDGYNCRWGVSYGGNGAPAGTKYIWVKSPDSYSLAILGALEVYNVTNCNQLPRTDTTFSRRSLYEPRTSADDSIAVTGTFSRTITAGLTASILRAHRRRVEMLARPLRNGPCR